MAKVFFTKDAEKELSKFTKNDRVKVIDKVSSLDIPPPTVLDVRSIAGVDGYYRLRVGKIRIIFEREKDVIWIRKVGYRGDVYKKL